MYSSPGVRPVEKQECHSVEPFQRERRRESQEQQVTRREPESREEAGCDKGTRHYHSEKKSLDHDRSLSKMRP